jgi:hypothetical protein
VQNCVRQKEFERRIYGEKQTRKEAFEVCFKFNGNRVTDNFGIYHVDDFLRDEFALFGDHPGNRKQRA